MFERYTEKARRVIFFARYEASNFGCPHIETEHLLLGLLREDKVLVNTFLGSNTGLDSIRQEIEEHTTINEKISTSVDLPLSQQSRRVLAFGVAEAERSGHKHVGTMHLLAGLLQEEKGLAAEILIKRGVHLDKVRGELARTAAEEALRPPGGPADRLKEAIARVRLFEIPTGAHAEFMRQAQARGVDVQTYLLELIEKSSHSPAVHSDAVVLKETFERLRVAIVAEGSPQLETGELMQEIARRKGIGHR